MTAGARRPFTTRHLGGLLVTGLALAVAVAALLGYVFGALTSGVSLHTATVDSEARGIFVHEDGLTYNIPLDVAWTDAQGGFHEARLPRAHGQRRPNHVRVRGRQRERSLVAAGRLGVLPALTS